MLQSIEKSDAKLRRFLKSGSPSRDKSIGDISTVNQVADNENGICIATNFMNTNDVGMLQLPGCTCLTQKSLGVRVVKILAAWNLYRDFSIQTKILSAPDFPEMSHPDPIQKLKLAKLTASIRL